MKKLNCRCNFCLKLAIIFFCINFSNMLVARLSISIDFYVYAYDKLTEKNIFRLQEEAESFFLKTVLYIKMSISSHLIPKQGNTMTHIFRYQ